MNAVNSIPAKVAGAEQGTLLRPMRKRVRSDLRASCHEGIAYGGMVGLGETFLPAFALALGMGELTAGLLSSVPLVAGGIFQLASPAAIRWLGSHKRWVVLCALVQAISFLPLVVFAVLGLLNPLLLLAIASVYWAAGLATGPAWNTWIGTIVPRQVRVQFIAIRTRWHKLAVFLAFIAGGVSLQIADGSRFVIHTFIGLFVAAGICRLVSTYFMTKKSEPSPTLHLPVKTDFRKLLSQLRHENGGRLLVYLVAVQASVQLCSPYFTPFMLEKLNFNYAQFVMMLAASFLAKFISLTFWAKVAKRIGALQLLWLAGIGIVPMCGLWLVSQHLVWLLMVQVLAGSVWAAYELAFFLLFFESIPDGERTGLLTLYNVINTTAWVVGAMLGAMCLWIGGLSFGSYLFLFGASSLLRAACLILLTRVSGSHSSSPAYQPVTRSLAVRPNSGSLDAPILAE
jgi:MFS family permease